MQIKEHPAILVLILTMGRMFSSRASVFRESLACSVIVWADDCLFCAEAFVSVSESPSFCLMGAFKGTDRFAVHYTKRQIITFLMKMYALYTYQETLEILDKTVVMRAFLRSNSYTRAPGDLNFLMTLNVSHPVNPKISGVVFASRTQSQDRISPRTSWASSKAGMVLC